MEKRKNKPMWILFLVLLVIFLIGLTCETVLKYAEIQAVSGKPGSAQVIETRMLRAFGDESLSIWAVPILLLNWMTLMPKDMPAYALRWIPYLVTFLLPVFGALLRRKEIPLIFCAVGAGLVSVGLVLVRLFSRNPYSNALAAIPFGVECLLLILACIALGLKKKGFAITLGVFALLLAILSPAASALLSGLSVGGRLPVGFPVGSYVLSRLRLLPLSAAISPWPIYKTFAFLMYALILFAAPKRFPKRG